MDASTCQMSHRNRYLSGSSSPLPAFEAQAPCAPCLIISAGIVVGGYVSCIRVRKCHHYLNRKVCISRQGREQSSKTELWIMGYNKQLCLVSEMLAGGFHLLRSGAAGIP